MNEENPTPADEKALAMYYAYVALVKTLHDDGLLNMDHLFQNLAGATTQLRANGETGAASLLGSMAESLTSI
jgi:hypothetical protein